MRLQERCGPRDDLDPEMLYCEVVSKMCAVTPNTMSFDGGKGCGKGPRSGVRVAPLPWMSREALQLGGFSEPQFPGLGHTGELSAPLPGLL